MSGAATLPPSRNKGMEVNGIRLHVTDVGEGPLLVLLHGFPENGSCWNPLLPSLVAAGYRVVVPDLRGYNHSDKPKGIAAYRLNLLARDIHDLVNALGERKATLIGHDWGGVVAFAVALLFPASVHRLVVINAPHPGRFIERLWISRQLLKSWYVFACLCPVIPEAYIRFGDFKALRALFRNDPVRPDAYPEADVDHYIEGFRRPGALQAALNYYRAGVLYGFGIVRRLRNPIECPTLILWGMKDPYLDESLLKGLDQRIPDLRIERYEDASHWIIREYPERVSAKILSFLEGLGR